MKLLICGDSYGYNHRLLDSWVTKISELGEVTNLSQCGVSEYKILHQLLSVDLDKFEKILILHTSPNRVHVNTNTFYSDSETHKNCDLLFGDVESKKDTDFLANLAYNYFIHIFDLEYYSYIHNLICQDIDQRTKRLPVIHITAFDYTNLYQFDDRLIDFSDIASNHFGDINHLTKTGNMLLYDRLLKIIK
jgi:hypothetical protein